MFTGIIEEKGKINKILKKGDSVVFEISAGKVIADLKIGDSVALNGVCLTVTEIGKSSYLCYSMPETIRNTCLSKLKVNDEVNLERAVPLNGRLGGHLVQGHVDGIGIIKSIRDEENSKKIRIQTSDEIMRYIIYKGSIALDGISLTVSSVSRDFFEVSIIPHTQENTNLLTWKLNDSVNIETDITGRYIEHFLKLENEKQNENKSNLTLEKLSEYGYI